MLGFFKAPITGPKFFAIFASFFVLSIAVNLVMAFSAVRTFPGLEVKNSYVASQEFDRERAAQVALGWTAEARVEGDELILELVGADGQPVGDAQIGGIFGRPTNVRDDQTPEFVFDGKVYRAPIQTAPGNWDFRLRAVAADGTNFQHRLQLKFGN